MGAGCRGYCEPPASRHRRFDAKLSSSVGPKAVNLWSLGSRSAVRQFDGDGGPGAEDGVQLDLSAQLLGHHVVDDV